MWIAFWYVRAKYTLVTFDGIFDFIHSRAKDRFELTDYFRYFDDSMKNYNEMNDDTINLETARLSL